jgi:hypothetical protein
MDLRRGLAVVTLLVAGGAALAPSPAVAGKPLSMDDARHQAAVYANEICLVDEKCKKYEIKKCARIGKSKVLCRTLLVRKHDECRYRIKIIRKSDGELTGKLGEIVCK